MKNIKTLLLVSILSLGLFSCEKVETPPSEAMPCEQPIDCDCGTLVQLTASLWHNDGTTTILSAHVILRNICTGELDTFVVEGHPDMDTSGLTGPDLGREYCDGVLLVE